MIYLTSSGKSEVTDPAPSVPPPEVVEEDEIDKYLSTQDGWTPRPRDPRLCQHGSHGRCQWCLPIAVRNFPRNFPTFFFLRKNMFL